MTQISDLVVVNVNIQDTELTRAGFGTLLIVSDIEDTVFSARTKEYNNITEVDADFESGLDIHKALTAFFSQSPRPPKVKVGRQEIADSTLAAALVAIDLEDQNYYGLSHTNHLAADFLAAKNFIKTRKKIHIGSTNAAAELAVGSPLSITGITRVGQVATAVAAVAHSLSNGDIVKITGSDQADYNITAEISNITTTEFDYTVTGTPTTPATGTMFWQPASIGELLNSANEKRSALLWHHLADSEFPEVAWFSKQLPTDPGSSTWNLKQLNSITGSEITDLTSAEEAFLLGNNSNAYTVIGATGAAATRKGTMGGGRFIDVQRSQDWIEQRISEAIVTRLLAEPKVPYTDAGVGILEGEISAVMQQAVGFGMLGPILTSESGEFFRIASPKVADQSGANRVARIFPGIVVTTQLAGAIHETDITVNVSV